jgi:hypothetical protein
MPIEFALFQPILISMDTSYIAMYSYTVYTNVCIYVHLYGPVSSSSAIEPSGVGAGGWGGGGEGISIYVPRYDL